MNNRTADHPDALKPRGDAAAKLGAWLHRRTPRRAWLAGLGVAGLATGLAVYRRLVSDEIAIGVVVHMRARGLPPLRFTDEYGAATSLAAFRGRLVLLNVWATGCAPCREEMPTRDRLQAALGGPNFEVVTVSIDMGGLPNIQAFLRQTNVRQLHPYLDTFHEAAALAATGIPLTLLIDSNGREAGRRLGPASWDDARMLRLIRHCLPAADTRQEIKNP